MWSRFRKEYLGQLIQRHGQKDCKLKVGDIVLVGCENLKRVNWPIARVQELSTGRDGRVRVVKVKTRNGILTRPVRKLFPLEVRSCTRDTIICDFSSENQKVGVSRICQLMFFRLSNRWRHNCVFLSI
ncbi:DUF5641 domain-containing protein [Trichonephila inaurata madagascariensis]|uniref:DUF5641 domain-containing protein n=1 Tax=Trichonephila inaurata madagascariensis TaxID=2747483 RepID=A0A8X7BS32_9ARAC|nr:DUF5641 domain-containing protein [Trichonephila inaurata madagascariensis]